MAFALGILTHTPAWVFALLAYIVWQGVGALRPRRVPLWRLLIVPAAFVAMGVSRVLLGMAAGSWPLVAAVAFAGLAIATGPRLLVVDRASGLVTRPGSPVPLIRNVCVFLLQYAVGIMTALHAGDQGADALISRAVSGATAGYFIGWSGVLLQRYVAARSVTAIRS